MILRRLKPIKENKIKSIVINYNKNYYYNENPDMFLKLKFIIEHYPKNYCFMLIKGRYQDIGNWVNYVTQSFLSQSFFKMSTKCFYIMQGERELLKCQLCNKPLMKNVTRIYKPQLDFCCISHQMQSEKIIQKRQSTNENNGHNKNWTNREQAIQTYKSFSTEKKQKIRQKTKDTTLKNNGYMCALSDPIIKMNGMERKYGKGIINGGQTPEHMAVYENQERVAEIIDKQYVTRHKNNSFTTNKYEDAVFNTLKQYFKPNDIKRNYKSEEYPFRCDFVILSSKLFIECNFHWTHGRHEFNAFNEDDQLKLKQWKTKALKSDYYKAAIDTWTRRDKIKYELARRNDLHYLVLWNIHTIQQDLYNFIGQAGK